MDYNWAKIFKEKSTAELIEIYLGKSFLPTSVIPLAKKELQDRNYDFEGKENLEIEIKLNAMAEEYANLLIKVKRRPLRSLPDFLIGYAIGVAILLISPTLGFPKKISLLVLPFYMLLITTDGIVSNYIRKKQLAQIDLLKTEIDKLVLENSLSGSDNRISIQDFEKKVNSELNNINGLNRNIGIIVLIILAVFLLFDLIFKK